MVDEPEENVTDINQLYQIIPDEVLGSGQFGIVYGGVYCHIFAFCSKFTQLMLAIMRNKKDKSC